MGLREIEARADAEFQRRFNRAVAALLRFSLAVAASVLLGQDRAQAVGVFCALACLSIAQE